jgi:phosphatidylglycerol:prolipoprotein diacylglycerol transferase
MFPDLLTIGPVTLHTYGLFLLLGALAGLMVAWRMREREGIDAQQILEMALLMILAGLIGSRALYVVMHMSQFLNRPLDMFKIWQGGLVFTGGIIFVFFIIALYARLRRLSFSKLGDLWAPAFAIGQGIGRIGCFFAGCCYGLPTDLKWGVVFTHPHCLAPLHVSLHPTQLYSAASGFVIFIVLLLLYSKKTFDGQVLLWFLILHSTARLAIERFRGDDLGVLVIGNMTATQMAASVILMAAVLTLFFVKAKRSQKARQRKI